MTAGPRGPALLQDIWLIEKMAHFDREVIPERRMHAKGWGAYGTFTVTHDITRYTKAKNLLRDRQADADVRPLLDGRRRARRRGRRARHPRLRAEVLHRGGQLGHRRQQHAGVLLPRSAALPRPQPRDQARPAHRDCAARTTTGISGRCCPRRSTRSPSPCPTAASRRASVTCTAIGSHTFSMHQCRE